MAAPHVNPALLPPGIAGAANPSAAPAPAAPTGQAFQSLLTRRVSFSNHAMQRVERRGIDVSPQTLARLGEGVDRAAAKGARSSVVFVSGTAFVVSVSNRTVVTAVDPAHMRDHVFTNIDSAVIA